ncbi:MAG TPA: hypothetical protein VHA73_15855 [Acidimicrobiales bacterium]|nr:hypothetical protein [Acidimicrobiales bacterium]
MTAHAPAPQPQHAPAVTGRLVWFVVATGPLVWMGHLAGSAALVPLQCRLGTTWMVNALTALCAAVIAASVVAGHLLRRRALAAGNRAVAFVALVGQAWGAISIAVTIVEGLPNAVLSSCPR